MSDINDLNTQDALDAVDRGHAVDKAALELQLLFAHAESTPSIFETLLQLSSDVGQAQAAYLQDDRKASLAFLLRLLARIRYTLADRTEFEDLVAGLGDHE